MYKAEVQVSGDDGWYGNNLEFKTKAEAETYAKDLYQRWTQTVEWRVVKVGDVYHELFGIVL